MFKRKINTFEYFETTGERITTKAILTNANRRMCTDLALCITATASNAGINTTKIYTGLMCRTISADSTFWTTIGWPTNIIRDTGTDSTRSRRYTLGIWSTRRR